MSRIPTPTLSFECSRCGDDIEETSFDLPGYDYSAEVHSDGRGVEYVEIACPTCEKVYSVEISNMFDTFEVDVPDEPSLDIRLWAGADSEEYDEDYREYLKSYVPDEPGERYRHSLGMLDEMVAAAGDLQSYPMFQRMLLLQHVAMMEAYLCDRLITLVVIPKVRTDLIDGYGALRNQSVPLVALASDPDLIAKRTTSFLKNQLYHELDAVEKLYTAALGVTPFPNGETKSFLKTVMINRHHCVHRDGKDNDGAVLRDVNASYINELRAKISDLVMHIEKKFGVEIESVRPNLPF